MMLVAGVAHETGTRRITVTKRIKATALAFATLGALLAYAAPAAAGTSTTPL